MAEGGVEGDSLFRVCVVGDRVVEASVVEAGVEEVGVAGFGVKKANVL